MVWSAEHLTYQDLVLATKGHSVGCSINNAKLEPDENGPPCFGGWDG
jgi:hypothetical protein